MYTSVTTTKKPSNHLNKRLRKIDWVELKECKDSNKVCQHFLKHLFQFMIIFSKSKSTDKNQKSSQPLDSKIFEKEK